MRPLAPLLLLLSLGCLPYAKDSKESGAPSGSRPLGVILREEAEGAILLVLSPHPFVAGAPMDGVHRAARLAAQEAPCSAAVFPGTEREAAADWLAGQSAARRAAGRAAPILLAGHGWGATLAAEYARTLLANDPTVTIPLLVTVDALKASAVGSAAGIATTLLTLNNPIPGTGSYFVVYDTPPPADGKRLRAHVNYYQTVTQLAHGGPMASATENHWIQPHAPGGLNHGNIDDMVFPLLLGDLRAAVRREGRP